MTAIATIEPAVTRLSIDDALKAAEGAIAVDNELKNLPYPRWVKIEFLKARFKLLGLGASDHALMHYREIAFEELREYQVICLERYPRYWADVAEEAAAMSAANKAGIAYPVRKKIKPDKLPLTTRQAELLQEVAYLMKDWQDHLFVRDELNKKHPQPE